MRGRFLALTAILAVLVSAAPSAAIPQRIEGPSGDPTCFDGRDNDRDGLVDFDDPDCIHVDYALWGLVFHDDNGNGVREDAEPALPGRTIHIISSDGYHFDVTTEFDGWYFSFIPYADSYLICEDLPPGWAQTSSLNSGDCESHALGVGVRGHRVHLNGSSWPGELGWAFGDGTPISGVVFSDQNGDAVPDDGEPGLEAWTIHLASDDGFHTHVLSDQSGAFSRFVPLGHYAVCQSLPEDWIQSSGPEQNEDCSNHASVGGVGVAPRGYAFTISPDLVQYLAGWRFGNRLGSCAQGGVTGAETPANRLLGADEESGPLSGLLHDMEGFLPTPFGGVIHEAGCAAAAIDGA